MLVERNIWDGAIGGPRPTARRTKIVGLARTQVQSGSGAFLAFTAEGDRWWVKPQNNPQGPRVPVTELIVGMAGALIGAPVCEVAVIEIPPELEGAEFRPGFALQAGLASGSRHVEGVLEHRDLVHLEDDDNRARHAGVFALYDWCWGSDDQWLYSSIEDSKIYSHDHGHYLPGGPDWTVQQLVSHVDVPHPQSRSPAELSPAMLDKLADRLERLSRSSITKVLLAVPAGWQVAQDELETVGWFLERRAPQVAERLRQMKGAAA
jgi:hypothetical protein